MEKTPLLSESKGQYDSISQSASSQGDHLKHSKVMQEEKKGDDVSSSSSGSIRMKRNLTLAHAVVFIIVNVTGTGIFVTPTGVTAGVGSVGLSLIIWTVGGFYNLVLALCYAELGTSLKAVAGGDFYYIESTLGKAPAFMALFLYTFLGPIAATIMARTAVEYLLPLLDIECHNYLIVVWTVFIQLSCATLNAYTVKWTAKALNVLVVVKFVAFGMIIILGIIQLAQGHVGNFTNAFEGSSQSAASIATAIIPGFVSYQGWDLVCSLAEEMKNPSRNLPLSLVLAVITVICIYVLMNVAYFSVLTPTEFISTNAAALLFAERVLPTAAFIIPVFVAISAYSTTLGIYLGLPRYTYAGAKCKQLPQTLELLSMKYLTPIPAIALQFLLSIFFSCATLFDLQALFLILGTTLQLKMGLALVGLLVLKHRTRNQPTTATVRVPVPIVVFCIFMVVAITVLSIYQDPLTNGIGVGAFALGLPVYYLGQILKKSNTVLNCMGGFTVFIQKFLLLVPAEEESDDAKTD